MRHSVTTPGGFFIGLGGIAASLVVAYAVFYSVSKPSGNSELRPQQIALGLHPKPDASEEEEKKVETDTKALLAQAAAKYNQGKTPNINVLDDLRGVLRFRESQKSLDESHKLLVADSNVKDASGKALPMLTASMQAFAKELKDRTPKKTEVKVDINPPAEIVLSELTLPNLQGGGASTVTFPAIQPPAPAVPAAAPATPAPATPAPAKPAAAVEPAPATTVAVSAAIQPNRPPLLLNGTEPTK